MLEVSDVSCNAGGLGFSDCVRGRIQDRLYTCRCLYLSFSAGRILNAGCMEGTEAFECLKYEA
jgi:hypothetical protein